MLLWRVGVVAGPVDSLHEAARHVGWAHMEVGHSWGVMQLQRAAILGIETEHPHIGTLYLIFFSSSVGGQDTSAGFVYEIW